MSERLSALSEGTQRALAFEGITSRARLAATPRVELRRLPGIGPTRLKEIERFLSGRGALDRKEVEQTIAEVLLDYLDADQAVECAAAAVVRLRELGLAMGPSGRRRRSDWRLGSPASHQASQ